MPFPRRFLSPREISEYTGLHVMTVYAMIARGEIKASRLGRKILVDKRQLDAQLEGPSAAGVGDGKGARP